MMDLNTRTMSEFHTIVIGKPAQGILPRSFALWMAATYVGLFIIRPWEVLFPQLGTIHFERIYAISMIFCVALTCGFRWSWNLQNSAVALFTGAVGVSVSFAWDGSAAWDAYYGFLTIVVCYCVLISVIRSPYDLIFILGAYIGFMELYLAKALWEYFIYDRHIYGQGISRLIGIEKTFGNFNELAGSIVISFPLWYFLWLYRRHIFAQWPEGWRKCMVCGLATYAVLGVFSVFLTLSRGGMMNMCVFLFLAQFQKRVAGRVLRNVILALFVIGIVWLFLPEVQKTRLRTIWDPTINETPSYRSKGASLRLRPPWKSSKGILQPE